MASEPKGSRGRGFYVHPMQDVKRESSVTFSLRELEALERERVDREAATAAARRAAEERARAEQAERTRREETARLEEEEARRARAERERREEEARLTALERAAVERVRLEVSARAEAELAAARREHDAALARYHAAAARSRDRWIAAVALLTTVALGAFAAILSRELHSTERRLEAQSAALSLERQEHLRATSAIAGTTGRVHALEEELATLRAKQDSLPAPSSAPSHVPAAHRPHDGRPPPVVRPCTNDGDPMNGCIE